MGITDRILTIEQSAEAAWPALREETLEGWRLRFADGFTRRSNSVQPFQLEGRQGGEALDGHPSMEGVKEGHEALVGRIAACEAAYHAMDQPAIFRILPPLDTNGLADVLSGRGYRREGETVVMTREFLPEYSVKDGKVTAFEDPLSGAALAALIRLTHTPERHQGTFAALLKRGSPPADNRPYRRPVEPGGGNYLLRTRCRRRWAFGGVRRRHRPRAPPARPGNPAGGGLDGLGAHPGGHGSLSAGGSGQ